MGGGFLEKVYQDALEIEFQDRGIPFQREKHIAIEYKGRQLQHDYFADFVCYDKIVVELKALNELTTDHKAQLINYLHCANLEVGLLINFGKRTLEYERLVVF